MRAFVAIPVDGAAAEALLALQARLPVGRPVAPDNLHLTLAFLGDQPEALLADLDARLSLLRRPAFTLRLAGAGTFGGKSPRGLHAGLRPCPALTDLRAAVARAARSAGVALAHRRFRPHVTLLRLRPHEAARLAPALAATAGWQGPDWPVRGFGLYRSTLLPEGARHDLLAAYPLGAV